MKTTLETMAIVAAGASLGMLNYGLHYKKELFSSFSSGWLKLKGWKLFRSGYTRISHEIQNWRCSLNHHAIIQGHLASVKRITLGHSYVVPERNRSDTCWNVLCSSVLVNQPCLLLCYLFSPARFIFLILALLISYQYYVPPSRANLFLIGLFWEVLHNRFPHPPQLIRISINAVSLVRMDNITWLF